MVEGEKGSRLRQDYGAQDGDELLKRSARVARGLPVKLVCFGSTCAHSLAVLYSAAGAFTPHAHGNWTSSPTGHRSCSVRRRGWLCALVRISRRAAPEKAQRLYCHDHRYDGPRLR